MQTSYPRFSGNFMISNVIKIRDKDGDKEVPLDFKYENFDLARRLGEIMDGFSGRRWGSRLSASCYEHGDDKISLITDGDLKELQNELVRLHPKRKRAKTKSDQITGELDKLQDEALDKLNTLKEATFIYDKKQHKLHKDKVGNPLYVRQLLDSGQMIEADKKQWLPWLDVAEHIMASYEKVKESNPVYQRAKKKLEEVDQASQEIWNRFYNKAQPVRLVVEPMEPSQLKNGDPFSEPLFIPIDLPYTLDLPVDRWTLFRYKELEPIQ